MVDIVQDHITAPSQERDRKPQKQTQKPHVVILLDESGSMISHQAAVVSTFNEYRDSVKQTAKTISLYAFHSDGQFGDPKVIIRELIYKMSPSRVPNLKSASYDPNGGTPLYDSMAAIMDKFRGSDRPVQFVTHTDGQENTSREMSYQGIADKIDQFTRHKGWLFVYLGEGLQGRTAVQEMPGLKMMFSPGNRGMAMNSLAGVTTSYAMSNDADAGSYTVSGKDTLEVDDDEQVVSRGSRSKSSS